MFFVSVEVTKMLVKDIIRSLEQTSWTCLHWHCEQDSYPRRHNFEWLITYVLFLVGNRGKSPQRFYQAMRALLLPPTVECKLKCLVSNLSHTSGSLLTINQNRTKSWKDRILTLFQLEMRNFSASFAFYKFFIVSKTWLLFSKEMFVWI